MRTALICTALVLVPGCQAIVNLGDSEPKDAVREARTTPEFDRLAVGGGIDVEARVGDEVSIEIEAAKDTLSKIETEVDGETLHIRFESGFHLNAGTVRAKVVAPAFEAVEVTGSGDVDLHGVHGEAFTASVSGSGDVRAEGAVSQVSIQISGSGDVDTSDLESETASVRVSGSGDVSLHASQEVRGSVSGSGDVSVRGGATCAIEVSGSGDVDC